MLNFFLRGKLDPQGSGFVQVMADKWLSVSEIFGATKATVESYSINEILPRATTDYVLVNIIATLGWAVGIALIAAVAALIIRLLFTTRKIKDSFGFYVSLSACMVLTVKFISSILINFNLSPLMSMSMPLISYGGTDYIVNMFLIGLVLSVWRRNNLVSYKTDTNAVTTSSKSIISFTDGKLVIDFKAWK